MDAKEKYAKAQGSQAKRIGWAVVILHLISIPLTAWGFYQSHFGGTLAESNFWLVCLSVAIASAIRYVIGSQEVSVSRQIVWWAFPNWRSIVAFIVSSGLLLGLIYYDHQTSQVGRIAGIDEIAGDADLNSTYSIDSTYHHHEMRYHSIFQADSIAAMSGLEIELAAHKSTLNAARSQVQSMRAKAKRVKAKSPGWAAGIRENARNLETKANSDYNKAVAESRSKVASTIRSYRAEMRQEIDLRDSLATADLVAIRYDNGQIKQAHDNKTAKAQSAGKWIVVITSAGSFLLRLLWELYRRVSGLEMEGEVYDPSEAKKTPLRHVYGFINDHIEVIDQRLQATREDYVEASKDKGAYQLPPAAKILPFVFTVALLYSVGQTFVFTEEDYNATQQSIFSLPFPYNWGSVFVCGVALIVSVWKNKWNGKLVSTVSDTNDTDKEAVSKSVPKVLETRVAQEFEEDTDSGEIELTSDEISALKKYCRTNYERIHTAATQNGSDSARKKHRQSKASLRAIGVRVSTGPKVIRKRVKKGGKQVEVAYRELVISD